MLKKEWREIPTFEAEILKVVDSLGVDQLGELIDGASVVLTQLALGRDVVVLGGPACEPPLWEIRTNKIREEKKQKNIKSNLIKASCQTRFFSGCEDHCVVQVPQHLIGHALERPWSIAHIFCRYISNKLRFRREAYWSLKRKFFLFWIAEL